MSEKTVYGLLLVICGFGWWLWIFSRSPETRNRGTLSGIVRTAARRIAESLPKKNRILQYFRDKLDAEKQYWLDQEIFDSSMLLKNLAIVERERAFSADYLYEKLMENAKRLRPVYGEMLSLYRSGRDQDAFQVLADRCGTRAARNFSMVLAKVDRINPDALVEQMEVFQEVMRQQRMTQDTRRLQRNSLIVTMMATVVIFIMLIDFAVVVVFLHTMDLVSMVF